MKRSEINDAIDEVIAFLEERRFYLPPWAFWGPDDWKGKADLCSEIIKCELGWEITDFNSGDFASKGLVLFIPRNGDLSRPNQKDYSEKVMIADENQETPLHYHWQ